MALLIIGIILGFIIGWNTQHEVKFRNDYTIEIKCNNEADMKDVMRQLKGIDKCQKKEE